MKRKVLIGLLAFGAVGGIFGGIASMHRRAHFRHDGFERRVSEICVEAAHRVYTERSAR